MGFQEIAKNVMLPGWHQTGVQNMFSINKKAYDELPPYLQQALIIASYETQMWDIARSEKKNAEAILKYQTEGVSFNKLDAQSLNELRKTTDAYLTKLRLTNPLLDKILGSQNDFIAEYSVWKDLRGGVAAFPKDEYLSGKHYE
jgi:TRAP-type mannitol/chloroaromatic compound transport system substrate-binding protein